MPTHCRRTPKRSCSLVSSGGLGWIAVVGCGWVLLFPLLSTFNRRYMERRFAKGSVTEVELGDDALILTRPDRTRVMPYASIARLRPSGSFMRSGDARSPDGRAAAARNAARRCARVHSGACARCVARDPGARRSRQADRRVVVPAGWAARVAAVQSRAGVRRIEFWVRLAVGLLGTALLAVVIGRAWLLLLTPLLAAVGVCLAYAQTRHNVGVALPAGSVATTESRGDRLVSRNTGGVREIRYEDIRSLTVREDVVLLRLTSASKSLAIARALVPDELIERHRATG